MLVEVRPQASSRAVSLGLRARAAAPQTGCAPAGTFHLIGSIQPVREGVTPHRSQASSRSWPPVTSAVIAGDTLPAFIGTLPGSHALVREYDTRGHGGGLAALGASLRRVAGVSRP